MHLPHSLPLYLTLGLLTATLAGCGNDDAPAPAAPATVISGTVAVGAPLSGATVTLRCGSTSRNTTTLANGRFEVSVPTASLPCAMRATPAGGGQTLHSIANSTTATATANITPLTDLITALSVNSVAGQTLAVWFADPSNITGVSSGLAAAQTTLQNALTSAGYTVPSPFDPVATTFNPAAGDEYDDLLEAIATAISNSGTYADYAALLTAFVSGSDLPDADTGGSETCNSSGADNLLAFTGVDSLCSFSRNSSSAVGEVTVFSASNGDSVTVTQNGSSIASVELETASGRVFSCNACTGVTRSAATNVRDFAFNNTVLTENGSSSSLTVTGGSLIHPETIVAPASRFFGRQRNATDVSTLLNGFSGTGTLQSGGAACSFSYTDGTLSVSDASNTLTASFNGGNDDLVGSVGGGNSVEIRAEDGTASLTNGTQMPGSTRIQIILTTPFTGSAAYAMTQVRGRLYAADGSNTYVYCNSTGKSFNFTPHKTEGSLDFLDTDSSNWITVDATKTTMMASSQSRTLGGGYRKVVSFATTENTGSADCSITLDAAGTLTLSVTKDGFGTRSTSVSLIGKTLYSNINLVLRTDPAVNFSEPSKGYVIYTSSLGDTQNYVSWADTDFYEGPVEMQARVESSAGNFEVFTCTVRP